MKESGILFKGEMVRAILDGRKTVTRRVIKNNFPIDGEGFLDSNLMTESMWRKVNKELPPYFGPTYFCPYGQPGDRLWVRETCRAVELLPTGQDGILYLADGTFIPIENTREAGELWCEMRAYRGGRGQLVPSIHMPRWASRIIPDIVDVRVERVHDATEHDAIAEGFSSLDEMLRWFDDQYGSIDLWVWVIEFKRVMM